MSNLFESLSQTANVSFLPQWEVHAFRKTGRTLTKVWVGQIQAGNPMEAANKIAAYCYDDEQIVCGGMRFRVWTIQNRNTVTLIDPTKRNRKGDRASYRRMQSER